MHALPAIRILSLMVALSALGCSASRVGMADRITVEGEVTVRGNEPFTGVWLETDDGNSYILVLSEADRKGLMTPRRYRATGPVYRDEWNGLPLAHLRVEQLMVSPPG